MPSCTKCTAKDCNKPTKLEGYSFSACPSLLAGAKDSSLYVDLLMIYASATRLAEMPEDSDSFDLAVYAADLIRQFDWRRYCAFWCKALGGK